jgi:transposase
MRWANECAPGPNIVVALEGTRSHGIGLARAMSAEGMRVIEAKAPRKSERRGMGKTDPIDAHIAAVMVRVLSKWSAVARPDAWR